MPKPSNPWSGFTKADDSEKQRIIGLSFGLPGSRKTTFWLEAPGPIAVFSFDQGLEGVVNKIIKESPAKDIFVREYDWSPTSELEQQAAIDMREQFIEDFEVALKNARTIVIDKETDLWELYRYAEFGAPNDAPRNYPALNQRYRKLINAVKATDLNLGCIEGMKNEWVPKVNNKTGAQGAGPSGRMLRAGFSELDGLVHMTLYHTGLSPASWHIEVGKVRGPGAVEIAEQTFPSLSFPDFAQLCFPDSDPDSWL